MFSFGIFVCNESGKSSSIGECKKLVYHPRKIFAKSGYKSNMRYKSLIILLYFWLQGENQLNKFANFFNYFFLTSYGDGTPPKSLLFLILEFLNFTLFLIKFHQ